MAKIPIDPEIEHEARLIYSLILAGKDEEAKGHLMSLASNRIGAARVLTQLNCRWSTRVTRVLDSASCLSIIASLIFPIFACPKLYKPPYGEAWITTAVIYCLVYGAVLIGEAIVFGVLMQAYQSLPFVRARNRADGVKMKLAGDALISETQTSPELFGALVDARAAFASGNNLDDTIFDPPMQRHLAQIAPELIGALLDARAAYAANDSLDEAVFDSALARNLMACNGPIDLGDKQRCCLRHCLQEATWHITETINFDGYTRSSDKGKTANTELALAIVEFYTCHPDESALKTLNELAVCSPSNVSPKWRPVIDSARRVLGMTPHDDDPLPQNSERGGSAKQSPEHENSLGAGTEYRISRAVEVREREDEGPHYFLELLDGSVLLMSGQHLMDIGYREIPGIVQVRFPSTHMHIDGNDIICTGETLEYDILPERFWDVWGKGYVEDMTVITDVTFDELKRLGKRRYNP